MRFLLAISITFFICSLLWIAIVFYQMNVPRSTLHWLALAFEKKENYAAIIRQPKIVFVSGSNALYGYNSEELENYWQKPVVNAAVTIGFGFNYLLERSKRSLSPGDIAILPLEYSLYQEEKDLGKYFVNFIIAYDTDYFFALPFQDQATIFLKMEPTWAFYSIFARHFEEDEFKNFKFDNINERGDLTKNHIDNLTKVKRDVVVSLKADQYQTAELSEYFKKEITDYINWAASEDICLIVVPPSYLYFKEYEAETFTKFLVNIEAFYQQQGVAFIGEPRSYMYQNEYFSNSQYHLNSRGIEKRVHSTKIDLGQDLGRHCH